MSSQIRDWREWKQQRSEELRTRYPNNPEIEQAILGYGLCPGWGMRDGFAFVPNIDGVLLDEPPSSVHKIS